MQFFRRPFLTAPLLALMMLPATSGPSQTLPDLGDVSQSVMSPAQERKLGESIMRQVHSSGAYLDDPEVEAYLNTLGQRLVSAIVGPHPDFEFFAVGDPAINAFALPGGYIGVHTGLILLTQSESELAGVLAHEISHVTQHHIARSVAAQQKNDLLTLGAMALAILAARSRPDVASAAITGAQAANLQFQINFTRENESEADRIGFQLLDKAGFDTRAMPAMFERLQRAMRAYDNNAPTYLRTHPVTYERIADAITRAESRPYRQVTDSREFHFVRALLKSYQGDTAKDAITEFESNLAEHKYNDEAATRYGLVAALLRDKQFGKASQQLAILEKSTAPHPMLEAIAGQVLSQSGQRPLAIKRYQAALQRYPNHMQLVYDYPDALIETGQNVLAIQFLESQLIRFPNEARLHQLAAKSYAALGKKMLQHAHQGEYYARLGNLKGAIDQFESAIKAGDGNFYQVSTAESRLRVLKQELTDQGKEFGKLASKFQAH
ncbi:MAG: M48 family metalloprotease [Betaproteobacteria bacterium]